MKPQARYPDDPVFNAYAELVDITHDERVAADLLLCQILVALAGVVSGLHKDPINAKAPTIQKFIYRLCR